MQGVEDGDTIGAYHNRLAVQGERTGAQLGGGGRDRRIAVGPVIASPGEQAHRGAVPAHDQPVAVVLDLMNPVGAGRRLGGQGRNAGIDKSVVADAGGHVVRMFYR
jgi:hypothetical protein